MTPRPPPGWSFNPLGSPQPSQMAVHHRHGTTPGQDFVYSDAPRGRTCPQGRPGSSTDEPQIGRGPFDTRSTRPSWKGNSVGLSEKPFGPSTCSSSDALGIWAPQPPLLPLTPSPVRQTGPARIGARLSICGSAATRSVSRIWFGIARSADRFALNVNSGDIGAATRTVNTLNNQLIGLSRAVRSVRC